MAIAACPTESARRRRSARRSSAAVRNDSSRIDARLTRQLRLAPRIAAPGFQGGLRELEGLEGTLHDAERDLGRTPVHGLHRVDPSRLLRGRVAGHAHGGNHVFVGARILSDQILEFGLQGSCLLLDSNEVGVPRFEPLLAARETGHHPSECDCARSRECGHTSTSRGRRRRRDRREEFVQRAVFQSHSRVSMIWS